MDLRVAGTGVDNSESLRYRPYLGPKVMETLGIIQPIKGTQLSSIQDFCEEHYEDILSVIMDKIRRDKRKEVHARLDFGESPKKRRIREGSQNSSVRTLSARCRSPSERLKVRDRLRYNDRHVLDQLGQTPRIVLMEEAALTGGTLLTDIVLRAETAPTASKNQAARVWFDELPPESIDGYKDLKAAFLAYFMQQKKYVKDPVEIHNIKQRDGETIEDFMERFKVETGRMKGAPECMRISGFMHGVNNPELTKRLNEHVPKTMEEMMIATTAFIRGEAAAAGKKKGHAS
ncbi:reverse transcriptase domain-containing protein [Tanacetum coccineum]